MSCTAVTITTKILQSATPNVRGRFSFLFRAKQRIAPSRKKSGTAQGPCTPPSSPSQPLLPGPSHWSLLLSTSCTRMGYGIPKSWWGCTVRDDEHLLRGDRRVLVQLQLQKCVSAARESRIPVSKSLRAPDMGYILAYQHPRLHPRHRFCLIPNRRSELRAIVSRRYLTCSSDDQHNR
jgi:hypothetical protein